MVRLKAELRDFIEPIREDTRGIVLESVNNAGLQCGIEFVEGYWSGDRSHDFERVDECGGGEHPQLHSLEIGQSSDLGLGVDTARAKVKSPAKYRNTFSV